MSLYRKYRPQNFSNLVGQDHIKDTLLNELKHDHLTHAYLFAGPRGTGKTSTARLIAKALNCVDRSEDAEPCEKCEFCLNIIEGSLIDVIEIDAASNRGIDEIRDLREKVKFAPTRAKNKIYIIDEVHMLTKEAFNALLKTLEEPPANVYFILCTTEVHKIPETIISRCQRFDFRRIDVKTIMTRLSYISQKENIKIEDQAIELIARHVQGGLRDAISLLEQLVFDGKLAASHVKEHFGIAGHESVATLLSFILEKNIDKAIHLIGSIYNEGYDLYAFYKEFLEFLRLKLLAAIENDKKEEANNLVRIIEIFLRTQDEMKNSPIPQLFFELAIIKTCLEITPQKLQTPPPALLQKILKTASKEEDKEEELAANIKKTFDARELNTETLQSYWQRILADLNPPSFKRSLTAGSLIDVNDDIVKIGFSSKFYLEKINTIENKSKLEEIIYKIFNKKVKVVFQVGEIAAAETENSEDLAKKALEIFGGEEI